jgi:gamma-glutamyl-gamma-aminobutyrate hydrolase PuuD
MCFKLAVTMRVVESSFYDEPRDAISHDWIIWFQKHNFQPILVPNRLKDPVNFLEQEGVNALLMTNGENVHPFRYGGKPASGEHYSLERDLTEEKLYSWARTQGIRVLGVCRGFQMVNILEGGMLVTGLKNQLTGSINHVTASHQIHLLEPETKKLSGKSISEVNSFHQMGLTRQSLANGLIPIAATEDGVLEAFSSDDGKMLAVQWHPERTGPNTWCQNQMAVQFLKNGAWW